MTEKAVCCLVWLENKSIRPKLHSRERVGGNEGYLKSSFEHGLETVAITLGFSARTSVYIQNIQTLFGTLKNYL